MVSVKELLCNRSEFNNDDIYPHDIDFDTNSYTYYIIYNYCIKNKKMSLFNDWILVSKINKYINYVEHIFNSINDYNTES